MLQVPLCLSDQGKRAYQRNPLSSPFSPSPSRISFRYRIFGLVSVRLSLHPIKSSIQILFTKKGVKVQPSCTKEKTNQEVPPFVILHMYLI